MLAELPITDIAQLLTRQLSAIVRDIAWVRPEICVFAFLILLVLADLIFKKQRGWLLSVLAILGLVATLLTLVQQWQLTHDQPHTSLLLNMLQLDRLGIYFKLLICSSALFTVLVSINYTTAASTKTSTFANFHIESLRKIGEYYSVLFGVVLGAMLLTMSTHLLMIYLAIELISISSYILTNFNFNRASAEASIKYVLFGGVSSGIMLYGMSLLYGLTGSLVISQPGFYEAIAAAAPLLVTIASVFTISGFLFKISSVPFHLWAPDIYEGAPTPIAAFFSIVPKAAAFVVLMRFIVVFFAETTIPWQAILAVLALVTIVIGNFVALWQKNAKRMMAYSSIAHSGFVLTGVLSYNNLGMTSVAFYMSVYALMNLAIFLIINMISRKTGAEEIGQYRGLGLQYPWIGILALVVLISLTGLPPTAGFTAKLLVFSSLWQAYQASNNTMLFILLIAGLFNTVISLFYYLKIPYYMFFKKAETSSVQSEFNNFRERKTKQVVYKTKFNLFDKILAFVLIIPLVILFFQSSWLIELISTISFEF